MLTVVMSHVQKEATEPSDGAAPMSIKGGKVHEL